MPDPVRVSVSDVRRAIYRASGFASGDGRPSTELLGTLFHQIFRALMDPSSDAGWATVLDPENLDDHQRLREHVYIRILGPRLRENQASLQTSAREVLTLWEAVDHLCRYIGQLLKNSVEQKLLLYDPVTREWQGLQRMFSVEEELSWRLEDDAWSAPVLVSGVADAVWRSPASQRWCILELKLGAGSNLADLAQLCLYHEMIRSAANGTGGEISLFHFQPQLKREAFSEQQIQPVQAKLRALIGRLAGVVPDGDKPRPSVAHRELGARLVEVLEQFGPMVTLESDPVVGPSFLRFHIVPAPGVKVRKILPLGEDLAVQLRLSRPALIRLDGGTLVVDLQRPDRQTLYFREFRGLLPDVPNGNAKMLAGVDLNRQPRFADLSSPDCAHLLAVGTAGSGKSEWLRMALASLLATNTPETLRVMVIDPKRVTFGELRNSPFLLDSNALLYTPEEAIVALGKLIDLMEDRYKFFARERVLDLDAAKAKHPDEAPPRVVCFCDEYGNLVAAKKHREAIELAINQLGAKARAAGIHLLLATQDPRAQIVSPALKANLSGRVCLRTTSSTQSRMVLEQDGAESLLGHGDLLFKTVSDPVRLQAPLLEDAERAELFSGRNQASVRA